jgi:glutathionyl-hydroquinone reductase
MGRLVNGEWRTDWYDTASTGGAFVRSTTAFRNWITPDGAPGPSGEGGFPAESGRYHLYVSLACPWAHRTLIFRALKGLEDHITVDVVHPDMLEDGWTFATGFPGATGDSLGGRAFLREVYTRRRPRDLGPRHGAGAVGQGRGTIVSNESSEIIRMFNSAFDGLTGNTDDHWPQDLRAAIEPVNDRIYETVNNGVYRAGFATTQGAYDEAAGALFDTLDWLEDRLSRNRYLMGERVTEADWRLLPTLLRFDTVYHGHFKCNRRRIVDYPNLWGWTRELYQWPGIAETTDFAHITRHYHYSHESINPHRIVPVGPAIDWKAPHGRDQDQARLRA